MAEYKKKLASANFPKWEDVVGCDVKLGIKFCWGGFVDHYKELWLICEYPDGNDFQDIIEECLNEAALSTIVESLIEHFTPLGILTIGKVIESFIRNFSNCLNAKVREQFHVSIKVID